MNASTFSARVTISTLSDFYSAITSAIGTLKGPLHGGANEGVIHMLEEIGSEDKVDAYVEKQLAQKKKIMGIGHRVYKTLDPRAPHLQRMAVKLSEKLGDPKWIQMSERIAQLMKEKKNLNANVDFYSATVYYSLGIPTDLFTPVFAIARCCRLVRARPRAARGQPALPSAERIRRRAGREEGRPDRRAVNFAATAEGPLPMRSAFHSWHDELGRPTQSRYSRWSRAEAGARAPARAFRAWARSRGGRNEAEPTRRRPGEALRRP